MCKSIYKHFNEKEPVEKYYSYLQNNINVNRMYEKHTVYNGEKIVL